MVKFKTSLLFAALLSAAPAEEVKKEGEAQVQGGLSSLSGILPLGKAQKGIVYPLYEDGKLATVLVPKEMTRRDGENLDINGMDIEVYSPTGQIDYTIALLTALYHMPSEQLSSNDRTVIKGKSFTLEGDTMVYDTKENICRMTGNIRMVISNPSALIKKPDPKTK